MNDRGGRPSRRAPEGCVRVDDRRVSVALLDGSAT
jgi:hypothetical protein